MGFISDTLGLTAVNLANAESIGRPLALPYGIKSTDRVDRRELENDYRFDPIIFNTINKQTQLIMRAGFQIKTKTARWQKFWDDFFENIGFIGEEVTKEELVEYILNDMLMYGNCFVELVYDSKDEKIVDLTIIPEKKMDYAKNANKEVAIDEQGKPIGYVLNLPFGVSARGKGDVVPAKYKNKVSLDSNQVFMLPKRVAHFKLHTYGERFYGIGLIEPAHKSTYRKMMIEEARTNEVYTRGANTIIAKVGSVDHEPGDQEIQDTLEQIANFKHNRYFALPYWIDIQTLDVQDNSVAEKVLEHLKVNQIASTGTPMAIASCEGETANKQTLQTMNLVLELSLEHIAKKFSSQFRKWVLRPIAKTNNIPEVAEIKFGDIIAEDKNDKSNRLLAAVMKGVLAPEEVRPYILNAEDLQENPEAYKAFRNTAKSNPKKIPSAPFPSEGDNPEVAKEEMAQNLQAVELGGFHMPVISKRFDPKKLNDVDLMNKHQKLHVLWSKLEQGYTVGWSFEEIHLKHKEILKELDKRGIEHLSPINKLDLVS